MAQGQGWNPGYRELWALKDINLRLAKGVSLGVVGRNGAGKSTLLKVVCGVLHPTMGELWVKGRVAALVELGAGFDPELTGRENIYLGASVAGLSRKETQHKIDRIIDFSELGEFIDVPIKNYSSGMHARLGFSLATDVDPDILILDEILSVGDAAFQKKCLDRMLSFRNANRTILFVGHAAGVTESFTDETVTLESGQLVDQQESAAGLGNMWSRS
jgi:ABC-type polysaccharide/polyol phosphate transport system ATPase subunit